MDCILARGGGVRVGLAGGAWTGVSPKQASKVTRQSGTAASCLLWSGAHVEEALLGGVKVWMGSHHYDTTARVISPNFPLAISVAAQKQGCSAQRGMSARAGTEGRMIARASCAQLTYCAGPRAVCVSIFSILGQTFILATVL